MVSPSSASAAGLLICFQRHSEGALLKPVSLKVSPGAIILNYLNFETHLTLSSNSVARRRERAKALHRGWPWRDEVRGANIASDPAARDNGDLDGGRNEGI